MPGRRRFGARLGLFRDRAGASWGSGTGGRQPAPGWCRAGAGPVSAPDWHQTGTEDSVLSGAGLGVHVCACVWVCVWHSSKGGTNCRMFHVQHTQTWSQAQTRTRTAMHRHANTRHGAANALAHTHTHTHTHRRTRTQTQSSMATAWSTAHTWKSHRLAVHARRMATLAAKPTPRPPTQRSACGRSQIS